MLGAQRSLRRLLIVGMVGGALGGVAFALIEMAIVAALGNPPSSPLRAIGSIALGPEAMSDQYPFATALAVGLGLHLVMSTVYGAVFGWLLWIAGLAGRLNSLVVVGGVVFAIALWAVNFLVIAPAVFSQLVSDPQYLFSFTIAHFFYGLVLGAYLLYASPRVSPDARPR